MVADEYLHRDFEPAAIARVFGETSFWSARFGGMLLDHLECRPQSRILDVGCALGFPLFELAHRLGPSCQLVGVDLWDEALDAARERLSTYDINNVELISADASDLPFSDASFDQIVSNLGVNNFSEPAAAIRECFRVLAPRGSIAITTNTVGHMSLVYDTLREILEEHGTDADVAAIDTEEAHRGTRESHCALLEEAGFEVTRVVEDEFELRYLDGSSLLRHFLTRVGFLAGWREAVRQELRAQVFSELEQRLNEAAQGPGELRCRVPMLLLEAQRPASG